MINVLSAKMACSFWTCERPKVVRALSIFYTFDLEMSFAPQLRAHFPPLNFQKWSERGVSRTFWLGNVLRATTACTFSTSQLPKVVRDLELFTRLTWKCASRHNGVHFFDISTFKSGLNVVCLVHFDLEMRFARQRRALFRRLNFQEWSETVRFLQFWLGNALRATTASTFLTSQFPRVVRTWGVLSLLLTNALPAIQFFISHLACWFRTRCLSEPTFQPSGATNHWKNTVNRDFPTFRAPDSSFFSLLLCSDLLTASLLLSDSSHLCFSIWPYCRKFDF